MKKMIYSVAVMFITYNMNSQVPFLEEYTDINITYDHIYGENATVLYFDYFGEAIKEPLLFDLYQPVEESPCPTIHQLPLIIYFHSGNFLPHPQNQSVVGTRKDSSVVAMCKRLAKTGYVVASVDYRLGWNPIASSVDVRKLGLINAAYRGVQDANTCIRYFKKTVVEEGNPFRIDTNKIVLWGDDSGGFISLNAGCLDDYNKIPTASNGKFLLAGIYPMIFEHINGDVEGKKYGIMDSSVISILPFPVGDTLNYVNHPEYSSTFKVSVNMGGAVGDTAWIDPGQPGVISFHTPYDLTTPYEEGIVYVHIPPDTYLEVVEVQGSYLVNYMHDLYGNNDYFDPPYIVTELQLAVTHVANSRNDGLEGLLPIYGDTITDSAPWNFWDKVSNINSDKGLVDNPRMTPEKATLYMDTMLAYALPRLFTALELCTVSTTEIIDDEEVTITTYPNPASQEVFISSGTDFPFVSINVYDMKGTLINQFTNINANYFRMPVDKLFPGQYILKCQFENGISARQIVVE